VVQMRRNTRPVAACQRASARRGQGAAPVGNADLHPLARPVALGDRQGDPEPVPAVFQELDDDEKQVHEAVTQVLHEHFKPEFLNRIDDIVVFHRLSREEITKIIDVQLERLRSMLHERNISLVLEDSARELLAREGYDPNFGARPLKRAIQTMIQNPLAMKLLNGDVLAGQTVFVSARDGEMQFSTQPQAIAA